MKVHFSKYQGTGNDFILLDNRNNQYTSYLNTKIIQRFCDRRFGVGGDGLILLENSNICDFKMVYFNSDGLQSTMCGNGGRCITKFAYDLGLITKNTTFEAIDGVHKAYIISDQLIKLQMIDVTDVHKLDENTYTLDTGSPHYVKFVAQLPNNVKEDGMKIRYAEPYRDKGINVNFLCNSNNEVFIATYERGVEDETLSCGTGVTAAAIALSIKENLIGQSKYILNTKGGQMAVYLTEKDKIFTNIYLEGPAIKIFDGDILLNNMEP